MREWIHVVIRSLDILSPSLKQQLVATLKSTTIVDSKNLTWELPRIP